MSAQVQSRVRRRAPRSVPARGHSAVAPLDQISDGVILLDRRGRITFVNKAAERLLGCDRAECAGRTLAGAVPDLGGRAVRQRCQRAARAGEEATFEVALLGTRRPVQVRACPGGEERGAVTLCLTDLTRQRAAEAALRQTEARFRAIIEHAPVGIEQVALVDGGLLEVNAHLCKMLGTSREELLRSNFATIMHPDDLRRERKALRQLIAGQISSYSIEKRYRHGDGHWIWVRLTSAVCRMPPSVQSMPAWRPFRISIVEDISQVREIVQERTRLAAIVESSDDAILSEDLNGIIQTWNPGAERMFGYTAGEIVGQSISLLIPPERPEEREDRFLARIRRGLSVEHYETVRSHKDGRLIEVSLSLSPLRDASGRVVGAAKIARDLTAHRRMEQEVLHASTDEQRRIGQDLHDGLCQELVSLSMGAELLAQRLDGSSPRDATAVRKLSDDVQTAAERARRLSHGLNPVDVEAGGLPGALEQLARRVSESTNIACRLVSRPPALPEHLASLTEDLTTNLYRIAQEAVSNAVKHARASRIELRLSADEGVLALEVIDNGRGLMPQVGAEGSPRPPRPDAGGGGNRGIGLRTMTYRARVIGGDLTIAGRRRGGGTVVTCSVRLPGWG